jgi:glutamate carboxypeptidase
MHPYRLYAQENQSQIVRLVQALVECESPSDSPQGVNQLVQLLVEQTADIARPKRTRSARFGDHLRLEFELAGEEKGNQILGLGHSDTVWPLGTINQMPFRHSDGRLWGPGVLDMKAGLALFIYAVRALRDLEVPVNRRVVLLVVSDEELGSPDSRPLTEAEARLSDAVLVLEPGTGLTGKLKTARKSVGRYVLSVEGKAAHAGVSFGDGASAIIEAARQIEAITSLIDLERGITVNPGVMNGGTRSNVVAAAARVELDVRAIRLKDAEEVERRIKSLKPVDSRCKVHVEGEINRPPMERTKGIAALFAKAEDIAGELGLRIEESSTGGGSDGNFTAALGVPTLDGLGAVGEGAHAAHECILTDRIADRVALLSGLIAGI